MDVTVEVLIDAANFQLPQAKDAKRYINGDIVDIHLASRFAVLTGNTYNMQSQMGRPRIGFIHIRGLPEIGLDTVKELLFSNIIDTGEEIRKRQYFFDPNKNATGWDELVINKEITINRNQARSWVSKKQVSDKLNKSLDDTTVTLQSEGLL